MLKLVIADDEEIILSGLAEMVDWRGLGFEVVGRFSDGRELISALDAGMRADLILTDIRMEIVSGLDVARYVFEKRLPTKVILLSGYQDFDYARRGIRFGVFEYLTKPCALSNIEAAARKAAEAIREAQTLRAEGDEQRASVRRLYANISQLFFGWLSSSAVPADEGQTLCALASLFPEGRPGLLIQLLPEGGAPTDLRKSTEKCLAALAPEGVASFSSRAGGAQFVLLQFMNGAAPDPALPEKLRERLSRLFGISVQCRALQSFQRMAELAPLAVDAAPTRDKESLMKIRLCAEQTSSARARAMFEEMYAVVREKGAHRAQQFLAAFLLTMLLSAKFPMSMEGLDAHALLTGNTQSALDEAAAAIARGIHPLKKDGDGARDNVLEIACAYIEESCEKPLSLAEVAGRSYVHPAYLSRLFKKKLGVTFKEYQTRCRVRKANALLADPALKVYDIAILVGYQDVHHFYDVYKREMGKTPHEYREEHNHQLRKRKADGDAPND